MGIGTLLRPMELLMTKSKRFDNEKIKLEQNLCIFLAAGIRDGVTFRVPLIFLHRHHIPSFNLVLFLCMYN